MTGGENDPDIRFRFGHDARAIRQARESLDPLLCDPDDVIADDVRLATSEMVTNVILHTEGGGELRAWDPRPDVPLRVEVEDGDKAPPVTPDHPPAIGGRGLAIVAAVSDQWGYERRRNGKVVWAEFDRQKRQQTQLNDESGEPSGQELRSRGLAPRQQP